METKLGTLAGDLHAGGCAMAGVCDLAGNPTGERLDVHDVMTPLGKHIPSGSKAIILRDAYEQWCVVTCDCCPCEDKQ